ncbi:hypothetical protein ACNSOL_12010 (plasmid) [Aliarcobacter lanthieri]|uniref:DsbA family protein n=1 Tax=Aliarcobacter lanthieri TaxID=1355374 RepID=UPI003AAF43F0
MRKSFLLSIIATSFLFANEVDLDKVKNEIENLEGIRNFNTKIIEIKELKGADGWYTAKGLQDTNQGKRSFDMITNKEILIFGNAFNLKTGEPLNVKFDFSKLKDTANYKIGNGKQEFFLVTDPECPYCQQLEEKLHLLKDKATVYVYMTADVIPSHLAAKGTINYINSLPIEKRPAEANKLFLEKNKAELLKKIDKYNIEMYQFLLEYKANPEARGLVSMYFKNIEDAFGIKLDTDEEKDKFLNKKINELKNIDLSKVNAEYTSTKDIIDIYFKVNGTPSVFDINGRKLSNQFEMFSMVDVYDIDKIKELSKSDFVIKTGKKGAKKAYYFLSTQCPACVNDFNNKEKLDKLLAENEVHFFLGVNGVNYIKAEKELKYILSQPDNETKFKLLKSIMSGNQLIDEQLNKNYGQDYEMKIKKFIYQDQFQTLIMATPTIIFDNNTKK